MVTAIVPIGPASVYETLYQVGGRMPEKQFKLRADEIRPLAPGRGGCYATDHLTVDGHRVGYMYRVPADDGFDSGWRFFSGLETDEYANNAENLAIYDINTVANYDPEVIAFLDAPPGSAFVRDGRTGRFVSEAFTPSED